MFYGAHLDRTTVLIASILAILLPVALVLQRYTLSSIRTSELISSTLNGRASLLIFVRIVIAVIVPVTEPINRYTTTIGTGELIGGAGDI